MNKNIKNRLFKQGIASTILGILIIASAVLMMIQDKSTTTERIILLGIGATLLGIKDDLINKLKR